MSRADLISWSCVAVVHIVLRSVRCKMQLDSVAVEKALKFMFVALCYLSCGSFIAQRQQSLVAAPAPLEAPSRPPPSELRCAGTYLQLCSTSSTVEYIDPAVSAAPVPEVQYLGPACLNCASPAPAVFAAPSLSRRHLSRSNSLLSCAGSW